MNFKPNKFAARNVAIVAGVRTPFAKAGMDLAPLSAVDLGVLATQEVLARAELDPEQVDHVIIGNVAQPANAANISRVIALFAGIPKRVPAVTVQRNCASGLESISLGAIQIATGQADVCLVGGTESMSNIPILFQEAFKDVFFRFAFAKTPALKLAALSRLKLKSLMPVIGLEEGLKDPVSGLNMGQTAENLARDWKISRKEQDEFALLSHQKATSARAKLADEIAPAYVPPKFAKSVAYDVGPRDNQTLEMLAKLKPYFEKPHGTITVGNACPVTDGAAMLILMSEEKARAEGRKILGLIRSVEFSGCDPSRMGLGPAFASPAALDTAGMSMTDVDLVEINEAFAAQVIACVRAFDSEDFSKKYLGRTSKVGEIASSKLNVNGGAIALGHPVGTSGTRLVLTILKELERRGQSVGLATMCIGGGQGGACVVERVA
jgi:acetyl-CoA acyltransferase